MRATSHGVSQSRVDFRGPDVADEEGRIAGLQPSPTSPRCCLVEVFQSDDFLQLPITDYTLCLGREGSTQEIDVASRTGPDNIAGAGFRFRQFSPLPSLEVEQK